MNRGQGQKESMACYIKLRLGRAFGVNGGVCWLVLMRRGLKRAGGSEHARAQTRTHSLNPNSKAVYGAVQGTEGYHVHICFRFQPCKQREAARHAGARLN